MSAVKKQSKRDRSWTAIGRARAEDGVRGSRTTAAGDDYGSMMGARGRRESLEECPGRVGRCRDQEAHRLGRKTGPSRTGLPMARKRPGTVFSKL